MAKRTTKERGLGWRHEQAREYLLQKHKDGSPCGMCKRPLWLDPKKNYDYDHSSPGKHMNGVLQADHSTMSRSEAIRRGEIPPPPDRLLHQECNRARGAGLNDHLFSNGGANDRTAMPWPWAN